MSSLEQPPPKPQGRPQPGPPAPPAYPFAAIKKGETTIEQLLGDLIRLDRQSPSGDADPVLVEFPRCRHTVIFAVPRKALTGTTYHERMIGLWSRGCPVCAKPALDAFAQGVKEGMECIVAETASR